jgi:hypothetical protein
MEMRLRLTRTRVAMLVVIAAAIGAGVAYAAIPDSNGVYTACKLRATGTVRLIDKTGAVPASSLLSRCTALEDQITWNQVGQLGPAGPQGLKGDKGDTGDTGQAGPSAAYTNYGDGFHTLTHDATQTMASVTVPAGDYILSAHVTAIIDDRGEFAQCSFLAAATVHGLHAVMTDTSSEAMIGDVTLTGTSNLIFLRCNAQGGTLKTNGEMIATKVGSITASE